MNNKIGRTFSFYSFDSNYDRRTFYRSFRFVSLSVYIIGTLYLSLNNSYEYNTSEIIQFDNVNSRKLAEVCIYNSPSLGNENFKNGQQENRENTRSCCNNDVNRNNEESENNESESSTNNSDITKQLRRQELHDTIQSLTEIPSNEYLLKLWKQTIDVCTEGLQSVRDSLGEYKEKYGEGFDDNRRRGKKPQKTDYHKEFDQRLSIHQEDYTNKFNTLIQKTITIEELRSFILIFIGFFHNLIDYLFHRYKIKYIQVGMAVPVEGTIDEPQKRRVNNKKGDRIEKHLDEVPEENFEEKPQDNCEENPEENVAENQE
ncbi:Plasmodium exported protein (PHISTa), unknown, putative [Plasmodium sp. gorilla clade G3]|nr:Plasmodium exported protein (PHISTa), unknown, putative [Plasmodium sp. gorilla clade G3]